MSESFTVQLRWLRAQITFESYTNEFSSFQNSIFQIHHKTSVVKKAQIANIEKVSFRYENFLRCCFQMVFKYWHFNGMSSSSCHENCSYSSSTFVKCQKMSRVSSWTHLAMKSHVKSCIIFNYLVESIFKLSVGFTKSRRHAKFKDFYFLRSSLLRKFRKLKITIVICRNAGLFGDVLCI